MTSRLLSLVAVALIASACTEKLTAPAECPALCPGGSAEFRDTVLTASFGLDSSYSGYVASASLVSLLVGNGGNYGSSRGVVKFFARGDSVFVRDTSRVFTVDSAAIAFTVQGNDTTTLDGVLEAYRLPLSIDSLATVAQVDAAMTPDRLLKETPLGPAFRSGAVRILISGADLAKLEFTAADSTRLAVGFRLRAGSSSGVRIGASAAGSSGPAVTWYTKVNVADTTLRSQVFARVPADNFLVRVAAPPAAADLLVVGGYPVARSFIRFVLPPRLRDSVTIIRATLQLTTDQPMFGIPADSATLLTQPVLASLGPKSPIADNLFIGSFLVPGQSAVSVEVAALVRLWQGKDALPAILRLQLGQEGSTFLLPAFRSTRSASDAPTLRITYRRSFAFEGF